MPSNAFAIGLDIGGTKIAGGLLTPEGTLGAEEVCLTPPDYEAFLKACCAIVHALEREAGAPCSVGVGIAGWIDPVGGHVHATNLPFLKGRPLRDDLSVRLNRRVPLANDANCMALAEASDGAGQGYDSVLGLILGTGVGAGFVHHRHIFAGANGLAGEIGHLPLPFRGAEDGPSTPCVCGQRDCIESLASGPALARLSEFMTGQKADAQTLAALADSGDPEALRVLDRYFDVVAKATVSALLAYDPDVIVVGGGLSALSNLYTEVPKRWKKYAALSACTTKFVPARHGPRSGVRGAAWLGRSA